MVNECSGRNSDNKAWLQSSTYCIILRFNNSYSSTSSFLRIVCGVPLGSILGPILFLLCNNDLPRVSTRLKFLLYADDTNILYENSNTKTIVKDTNTEMPKIMEWFRSNKLLKNIDNTVAMLFNTT